MSDDPAFAIELIQASKTQGYAYRCRFGSKVGIVMYSREPRRDIRLYGCWESFAKDLVYLQGRTWPTSKAKAAVYAGCRQVNPIERLNRIVWC